jgi:hypothetical protein
MTVKAIEDLIKREINQCTPNELLYVFHAYRLAYRSTVEDLLV